MKEKAIIRKEGNQWCVHYGEKKECFSNPTAARKRLNEIEMFKHMKSSTYECECQNCGNQFMSSHRCDLSRCPKCGEYDCEEIMGET